MSEIDRKYSPSYWTKRYSQKEAVDTYIATSTRISRVITKTIPCTLNVRYGERDREKYDIYGTDLPNDAPILIFIHGGYWQYKIITKEICNTPARSLYKLGVKTLVIGYTLCPEYTVFEINQKLVSAIKKCLDYAIECGSKSVGISGHSAGAQMVISSVLTIFPTLPKTQQDLLKGLFLLGGIFDLQELVETSYNNALKLTKQKAKELSPMFQNFETLQGRKIKFFICVGNHDCPGFIEQSRNLYDVLVDQNLGKQVELLVFDALDHYELTEKLDDVDFKIIKIIAKVLLGS